MRANAFRAVDHIRLLNQLKRDIINSGVPADAEQLKEGFKSCGIPGNSHFLAEFLNSGLLVKVEGNLFVWKTEQPIHHSMLQSIYLKYQNRINGYIRTYREKKAELQAAKNREIDEAIALLKSKGYEIYAPVGEYFRKL